MIIVIKIMTRILIKLINKIYFKTKKDVINGENELKIYLSNENLKKIILD